MRARNIKPGFFKSEGLASCSLAARLLFIGLWCMADREGRLEDRPLRIKAEIFPYDNVNIEKLIEEIASKTDCDGTPSFIVRYGYPKKYIQILHFLTHQHPHIKEQESTIPDISTCPMQAPTFTETCPGVARLNPESPSLKPESILTSKPEQVRTPNTKFSNLTEVHMKLAQWLEKQILEWKPDAKTPHDLRPWANDMRLMMEQDDRTEEQIVYVIDYLVTDTFWRINVLSASTLRKQFDRLEAKMRERTT